MSLGQMIFYLLLVTAALVVTLGQTARDKLSIRTQVIVGLSAAAITLVASSVVDRPGNPLVHIFFTLFIGAGVTAALLAWRLFGYHIY